MTINSDFEEINMESSKDAKELNQSFINDQIIDDVYNNEEEVEIEEDQDEDEEDIELVYENDAEIAESNSLNDEEDVDEFEGNSSTIDIEILDAVSKLMSTEMTSHNQAYIVQTKRLLEQLLLKLDDNRAYEKHLEDKIKTYELESRAKDLQFTKFTQYLEDAIEKSKLESEEKFHDLLISLDYERKNKLHLENLITDLQLKNNKLKGEISLLRLAEKSSTSKVSAVHMSDLLSENEELKDKVTLLENELSAFKMQRHTELIAVLELVKQFENQIQVARK